MTSINNKTSIINKQNQAKNLDSIIYKIFTFWLILYDKSSSLNYLKVLGMSNITIHNISFNVIVFLSLCIVFSRSWKCLIFMVPFSPENEKCLTKSEKSRQLGRVRPFPKKRVESILANFPNIVRSYITIFGFLYAE